MREKKFICFIQCSGSGSGRIRIIWPDPHQETLIWIRGPKKIVITRIQINQNYKNIIFF